MSHVLKRGLPRHRSEHALVDRVTSLEERFHAIEIQSEQATQDVKKLRGKFDTLARTCERTAGASNRAFERAIQALERLDVHIEAGHPCEKHRYEQGKEAMMSEIETALQAHWETYFNTQLQPLQRAVYEEVGAQIKSFMDANLKDCIETHLAHMEPHAFPPHVEHAAHTSTLELSALLEWVRVPAIKCTSRGKSSQCSPVAFGANHTSATRNNENCLKDFIQSEVRTLELSLFAHVDEYLHTQLIILEDKLRDEFGKEVQDPERALWSEVASPRCLQEGAGALRLNTLDIHRPAEELCFREAILDTAAPPQMLPLRPANLHVPVAH